MIILDVKWPRPLPGWQKHPMAHVLCDTRNTCCTNFLTCFSELYERLGCFSGWNYHGYFSFEYIYLTMFLSLIGFPWYSYLFNWYANVISYEGIKISVKIQLKYYFDGCKIIKLSPWFKNCQFTIIIIT